MAEAAPASLVPPAVLGLGHVEVLPPPADDQLWFGALVALEDDGGGAAGGGMRLEVDWQPSLLLRLEG